MARPTAQMVEVEVHGLDELQRAFPDWELRTEAAIRDALQQVAELTVAVTALRVPVLTGAFRGSLEAERLGSRQPTSRVSEGGGLAYGRWLEYGRRKRTGKAAKGRYLPPTARRQKRLVKARLKDATNREIKRYPWPNPK